MQAFIPTLNQDGNPDIIEIQCTEQEFSNSSYGVQIGSNYYPSYLFISDYDLAMNYAQRIAADFR